MVGGFKDMNVKILAVLVLVLVTIGISVYISALVSERQKEIEKELADLKDLFNDFEWVHKQLLTNFEENQKTVESLQQKYENLTIVYEQLLEQYEQLLEELGPLKDYIEEFYTLKDLEFSLPVSIVIYKDGEYAVTLDVETKQVIMRSLNHTRVIQTAIDVVASRGGRIVIKSGTYVVDTIRLEGVKNVSILGEGWSTKLVARGRDTNVFKIGNRVDPTKSSQRIEIAYLMIDGLNQATEDTEPEKVERRFGIEIASPDGSTKDIYIHHVYIYNTGSDSIYVYGSEAVIAFNLIENTRGYWAAIHEHGAGATGAPPYPGSSHRSIIIGNIIRNSAVSAIRHGRIIAFNYVYNCSSRAFTDFLKGTIVGGDPGSVIIGNVIEYLPSGVSGITTWRAQNIVIGNTIRNAGRYGIILLHNQMRITPVSGHIMIGNVILYSKSSGIYVGSNNNVIKDNIIVRPGYAGIAFAGNGRNDTIVENNIIIDPGYPYNGYNAYGIVVIGYYNIVRDNKILVIDIDKIKPEAAIYELGNYNIIEDNYIRPDISFRQGIILASGSHTTIKNNFGYPTETWGVATIIGDGTSSEFVVNIMHDLISDKAVCYASSTGASSAIPINIFTYLIDMDKDGFREMVRIIIKFDNILAENEVVEIYWKCEVVGKT